jgi:hypothetical protein
MEIPDIGIQELIQEMADELDGLLVKYYKKGFSTEILASATSSVLLELVMITEDKREENFATLIKCMTRAFENRKKERPLV